MAEKCCSLLIRFLSICITLLSNVWYRHLEIPKVSEQASGSTIFPTGFALDSLALRGILAWARFSLDPGPYGVSSSYEVVRFPWRCTCILCDTQYLAKYSVLWYTMGHEVRMLGPIYVLLTHILYAMPIYTITNTISCDHDAKLYLCSGLDGALS